MKYRNTRRSAKALRAARAAPNWGKRSLMIGASAVALMLAFSLGGKANPHVIHVVEQKTEYLVQVHERLVDRACPESAAPPEVRVRLMGTRSTFSDYMPLEKAAKSRRKKRND